MWGIAIFGLSSGILLDVLVGLLGSRRNIGFGWAFILSLLFTPLIGFIIVLLSETLPEGSEPKYGIIGNTFGCLGTTILILIIVALLFGLISILLPGI